jgi:hypothetical protein
MRFRLLPLALVASAGLACAANAHHPSRPSCYSTPYAANKLDAIAEPARPPIQIDPQEDVLRNPGPLAQPLVVKQKRQLSQLPPELARIQRGYISVFESSFAQAEPSGEFFGIDLDRQVAFQIERYTYDPHVPGSTPFGHPKAPLGALVRTWSDGSKFEEEIVTYTSTDSGRPGFGGFVCSANALWASKAQPRRSGWTDAKDAYEVIIDTSDDGAIRYRKLSEPSGPVWDAAYGIRMTLEAGTLWEPISTH